MTSSKIYLLGGSSRNMKIYDPSTDEWENGPLMIEVAPFVRRNMLCDVVTSLLFQKRDNCSVTSVGEKMFVSGGLEHSCGPSLSSVECYCTRTKTWKSVDPMEAPLHR